MIESENRVGGFALVLSVVLMVPTYIINRWCPGIMGRNSV